MDFYTRFAPVYERVFPYRPGTLEFLAARLPERGRVLDLGCGTGHYTGALAGRGLEAVGVDLDEAMIDAARTRYPAALFVQGDLAATPSLLEAADGAFCIGNVLPHVPPAALGEFLVELAGALPEKAPWIVQTVNLDRLTPLVEPLDFPPLDGGEGFVFERRYVEGEDGSFRFQTRLRRDGDEMFAGEATLWPYTSRELAALHWQGGFELDEELAGFTETPFDPEESPALVQVYRRAVAQEPDA
jgi:glycine/sarcosine N-methyltransferase